MDTQQLVSLFAQFEHTIFSIKPDKGGQPGIGSREKRLFYEIILRAIKDLEYLFDPEATQEQFGWGRSALTWLFVERLNSLSLSYPPLPPKEFRQLQITSFDHICTSLELEPKYIREILIKKLDLSYMKPFV